MTRALLIFLFRFFFLRCEEKIPNELERTALLREETRNATGASLNYRRRQMWQGPPVRLDIYSISLFLEGSVEDTPGLGIGSVRTIQRKRPPMMMEKRACGRGTSLTFFSVVITCHGTMSLLTTTTSPGIWVTTVVK